MRIENTINKVKASLLRIYIMAVLTGLVYVVCMGHETKSPGEIIYEKTHILCTEEAEFSNYS